MDTKTTMELVAEAKGRIENLTPDAVARELEDPEVVAEAVVRGKDL